MDRFKKHLLRSFRQHIQLQFKQIYQGKQYHWVSSSKRANVRYFFVRAYNVPEDVYDEEESTFFKLIFNTVKDLGPFEIK